MDFHELRRQQFLSDASYAAALAYYERAETVLSQNMRENEAYPDSVMRQSGKIAFDKFCRLVLRYTGGAPIETLRNELASVVGAYELHADALWKATADRNEPVFQFFDLDQYCQLMQLIGLCFLLHRRDLLARVAALQDGDDGHNGGADNLYEEFLSHGLGAQTRYESDWLCATKPYQALSDALYSEDNASALDHLHRFLKHWYKDLAGTGWHDTHKPDEDGNQGGYYGYWSFEAGAAVILLGIEDDSSLHKYLYYPKDLVAWCRANAALGADVEADKSKLRLRCAAGEPCPRAGFWFTPAASTSRRHFAQGEVMPELGRAWGATIWQWDEQQ